MTHSTIPIAHRSAPVADVSSSVLKTLKLAASFAVLSGGALVMLLAAIPTLGLARRFYSEVIGAAIGRAILHLWGISYTVHGAPPRSGQIVYISNHTSTLDVFLLIALALPRARFFMAGFLRKIMPLGIIGYLIRMFWTVKQHLPEKRRRIFARADRVLRRTGDSVYLSPEGMRVVTGEIGHFNKGAFHLATSLRAPIQPIYIAIPRDIDPRNGYDARPGHVDIWFLRSIATQDWNLDNLEANRDAVRDMFVRVHDVVRSTGTPPAELLP